MNSLTIDRPLRATLHELGLNSADPAALAEFYSDALGYEFVPTASGLRGRRSTGG